MPDDFDYSAFLTQFITECREHLETMNSDLLALEADPRDPRALAEIVREAHTIKGTAKMMGAEDIAHLAHALEDRFEAIKKGKESLDGAAIDRLFVDFDHLSAMLTALSGGGEPLSGPAHEAQTRERTAPPAGVKPADTEETIRVPAKKIDDLANLAGELVINNIKRQARAAVIKDLLETYQGQETRLRALRERVGGLKLEGELGADINGLEAGRRKMERALLDLKRDWREDAAQGDLLIRRLTLEILGARMVPVATLFDTFARPVRDLAKQFGKEVELKIEGGETEFDRRMIEIIREPMIHMIRNAVDHGLEDPGTREKAGKPRRGTLLIKAKQEGDYVVIELSDDGAGIAIEKIRKKAVETKLASAEQAAVMSDNELLQLLFHSGFSTSNIITDISGRGVGMDVVKNKIEQLKGMVYVTTEAGRGTTVVLKVPLTLAMARVMFIRAGGQDLGIPTTSIEEAVRLEVDQIKTIEGREAMILRGHAVPVMPLAAVLGLPAGDQAAKPYAVILDLGGQRLGLLVDRMVGEQEVVIKTLGPHFRDVGNIAGATVTGAGRVVLILNPPDLLAASAESARTAQEEVTEAPAAPKRILVVDDSATARELEKNILVSAGYEVDEAVDGVDALAKVAKNAYDLLVVDVQMPRMDGLTLTSRIKNDERFADLPVIIVTTLEKEADKQRGIAAGADAYIIKRAFDQANLLSVIAQLIAA